MMKTDVALLSKTTSGQTLNYRRDTQCPFCNKRNLPDCLQSSLECTLLCLDDFTPASPNEDGTQKMPAPARDIRLKKDR